MNYNQYSDKYKPAKISVILIGEAPPSNGKSYFYKIPDNYQMNKRTVANDSSMASTIFNHYFCCRPKDKKEYESFLCCLKERGIFLIDIINVPLEIKKKDKGFNIENINKLVSKENLNDLESRINKLVRNETKIIFLLPTGRPYIKELISKFKKASFVTWKCFRLDIHEAEGCEKKTSP